MMRFLRHVLGNSGPAPSTAAFRDAMETSDEAISRMREASQSKDVFRAVMANIWLQKHNIPFMVTVYEAVREMASATTDQQAGRQDGASS